MDTMKNELTLEDMEQASGGIAHRDARDFYELIPRKCPNPECNDMHFRAKCIRIQHAEKKDIIVRCITCNKRFQIFSNGQIRMLD